MTTALPAVPPHARLTPHPLPAPSPQFTSTHITTPLRVGINGRYISQQHLAIRHCILCHHRRRPRLTPLAPHLPPLAFGMADNESLSSVAPLTAPSSVTMHRDADGRWTPHERNPREGSMLSICCSTILSCGLGGLRCNEGGVNPHLRCCRQDTADQTIIHNVGWVTCCYCCCLWDKWAGLVHHTLGCSYSS